MTPVSSKDFPTMRMDILPKSIWIEMIQQKPGAMISLKREEILIIFFGIAFFNFSLAASQFLPFCVQGPKGLQGGTLAQLAPMLRLGSSYFTRTVGLGWFGQPSCDLRKQPPRRRLRPAGALQHFQMAFEKNISRKSLKKALRMQYLPEG